MYRQKYLDKAKKNGWTGIDESTYESLFMYGLLWIYRPKLKDFLCIIGIHFDDESQEFDEFATEWFDKSVFDDFENLINNEDFRNSVGIEDDEWTDRDIEDIPFMIYDIMGYYGRDELVEYDSRYSVSQILAYISKYK